MVDTQGIGGISGGGHSEEIKPKKGILKSQAQAAADALSESFKKRGINPESAYILDKDLAGIDVDGDGKISRKEAKAVGLSARRADRKAAADALKTLQPQMKDFQKLVGLGEFYPEQTDDGLNLYDESGKLQYVVTTDENGAQIGTKPDGTKVFRKSVHNEKTSTEYFDATGSPLIEYIETQGLSGYQKRTQREDGVVVYEYTGDHVMSDVIKTVHNPVDNTITDYFKGGTKKTTNYVRQVTPEPEVRQEEVQPKPEVKQEEAQPELPKFNDVFTINRNFTIDETGSTQRLTKNNTWETAVVIPKRAQYDGNGVPKEIAIALPGDYGAVGPDGKAQKRYQSLKLIDAEQNIYSDARGTRRFQMKVEEDGITLKQVSYDNGEVSPLTPDDSEKIKTTLNEDVKATQEQGVDKGQKTGGYTPGSDEKLSHGRTKIQIESYEDANELIDALKDRNLAWGTYTSIGSDNGFVTGNLGLIEYLSDNEFKDADSNKHKLEYKDIKPALEGLMSRVPQNMRSNPNYITAQRLIKAADDGEKLSARPLDVSLMALAREMELQGTNFMPNQYLRGPAGDVMITPDRSSSMWNTDAKFNLPTTDKTNKDFYFYRTGETAKCYDFQDIVGDGGLITNDATGNSRQGEINFDASKLDPKRKYYFQTKDGKNMYVTVKDGQAYIIDKNNKEILVNDILNGRVPMPFETY